MRYYLSKYIGTGTDDDPFRPSGADDVEGWSAIDLRPDKGVVDGFGLFASPSVLATSPNRLTLTDDPDEDSSTIRTRLENRLGVNLDQMRFRRLILHLLLDRGSDSDPRRWKRLRPTANAWEVWLGGQLIQVPRVQGAATYTESFNKADSVLLGPDLTWEETNGSLSVINNLVRIGGTASQGEARAEHDLATPNHYASVVVETIDIPSVQAHVLGPMARMPALTRGGCWWRRRKGSNAANTIQLTIIATNGTTTTLGSVQNLPAGDPTPVVDRIECEGSTIRGLVGGALIQTATDTTFSTELRTGFRIVANSSAENAAMEVDNFEAGDLAAPVSIVTIPSNLALANQGTAQPGPISKVIPVQPLTLANQGLLSAGAVSRMMPLQPLALANQGQAMPGPVSSPLLPQPIGSGQSGLIIPGNRSKAMPAQGILLSVAGAMVPGARTIEIGDQEATLLSVAPVSSTRLVRALVPSALVFSSSEGEMLWSPGPVLVAITPQEVAASVRSLASLPGAVAISISPNELALGTIEATLGYSIQVWFNVGNVDDRWGAGSTTDRWGVGSTVQRMQLGDTEPR